MAERTPGQLRQLLEQARQDRGVVETSLRGIPVPSVQARTHLMNFIDKQTRFHDVLTGYMIGLRAALGEIDIESLRRMVYGDVPEDFDSLTAAPEGREFVTSSEGAFWANFRDRIEEKQGPMYPKVDNSGHPFS